MLIDSMKKPSPQKEDGIVRGKYHGFVYLLSNKSMPNIYKIGFTTLSPYKRVSQLSRSTSCPTDFEIVCFAEFDDCFQAEKEMHDRFSPFRVNPKKEFFKFSIYDIVTYVSYSICEEAESGCMASFYTEKHKYFLKLFHENMEYI